MWWNWSVISGRRHIIGSGGLALRLIPPHFGTDWKTARAITPNYWLLVESEMAHERAQAQEPDVAMK
jgi:hypothetical protein